MSDVLLKVENICKFFPGVKALQGVSFDIRPGEVHALCGENGAGKSTLIKVLTGAHKMDGGSYLLDGADADIKSTHDAISKGIACIYQEMSIVPQFNIAKNLYLGNLPLKGGKRGLIDYDTLYADSEEILKTLGLSISPKVTTGSLSVGLQQMVEIGRALTRNARIIIMDEPTASLSEKETETLLDLIQLLSKKGVSIIYISHKLDEVMKVSDRITILRDGENVVTVDTDSIDPPTLISHMLGRSLENMYTQREAAYGEVVLDVKNLTRKNVFNDISFTVRSGEILGFFGLVGAGRTEIMRAVFGADEVDGGEVIMEGKALKGGDPLEAISKGIAFVTEDRKEEGLLLNLSILTNMTLVKLSQLANKGVIDKKSQSAIADEYISKIRVKTPSSAQLAGNLSGGNQQKVVLAKWLMMNPRLLILDEPTRGIDVGSKAEIYALISELAQAGMAVIIVSSEIEEIMGVCDRVIVIAEGRESADLPMKGTDSQTILTAAFGEAE